MREPEEIRKEISYKWLCFGRLKKEINDCECDIIELQKEFEEAVYPLDWKKELWGSNVT